MSFSWMLLVPLLLSWASATTESSRGLHVSEDFSNGENLSRGVNYLSKNDDAASIRNDDLDGVRKASMEVPIPALTDNKPVIEHQNLVDDQIGVADLTPSLPFDGDDHSIEPNRNRTKSCPPGCTSFRIGSDDSPRCRCIRELTDGTKGPGPVRNIILKSVFARNFTFGFDRPLETHAGHVNFTVLIKYIKLLGCEKLNRKSPSTSNEGSAHSTVWNIIENSPYAQYNVTVMANTNFGQGPPVSIVVETLPLDIPVSKVSNLRLANESTLAWDPPEDCTTITGPEKVTRLDFSCLSDWGKNWNASYETLGYEFDLKRLNLLPSTRYKVCAFVIMDFHKPANESNYQELQWTTESVAPGPVRNLILESVFADNFTIKFDPPLPTQIGFVNYTVILERIKYFGCEKINRKFSPKTSTYSYNWTSWFFTETRPYVQYNFTVMANTISGQGPPVSIVFDTPPLDIPVSKVSNLRLANESTLAWDPPEDCTTITGPEKVTRLDFSCLSDSGRNWNASHETMGYEFDLKILNLLPSTRYKVRAYVIMDFHKPANESNYQELQWTTSRAAVPGPVRNLTLESVLAQNFTIRYDPPLATHAGFVNFTVIVQLIKQFGCEKLNRKSPSSSNTFLEHSKVWNIFDSLPYAQYNVTVMANTSSGQGPPVSIVVETLPLDIPVSKVSNLRLANESTLAWDPPEDCTTITGPEKVTRLKFSCLSDWGKNWNASYETLGYEFDLKRLNLLPSTRYKVCAYVIMDFHKPANESNCQELQWTTESVVPGPVRNLTLESVLAQNFTIRYDPPLATHAGFVNFTVIVQVIKYLGCEELNRKTLPESKVFLAERTEWVFPIEHPYVEYNVIVMANTASGQGPPVSIVFATLPLDIPVSKVSNLRLANESTLAWDPPEDCTAITGPEKVTRLDFSCLSDWGRNWRITKETSDYKFDLEKLKLLPSTRYRVCAYVIRDYGKPVNRSNCQELEWTTESVRPPPVKSFEVYDANAAEHTISVRWEAHTPTYGDIESYRMSLIIGNSVIQNRTVKVSELEKCSENYVCLRNWTLPSNVSTNDVIKLQIFAKNTLSDENGVEITKWFTLDDLYHKGKQSTASILRFTSKASHTHSSTVQCYNVMLLLVHVIFTKIKLF